MGIFGLSAYGTAFLDPLLVKSHILNSLSPEGVCYDDISSGHLADRRIGILRILIRS
jgi:hypothetical protein